MLITIYSNISKIYESKLNYEDLKKYSIFKYAKNISEIIKEMIKYINNNQEYKFINKGNNLILEIIPKDIQNKIVFIFEEKKDKIELIQKLMNDLEIFFSCIFCKKIVFHPYSCNCQKFICENCFLNDEKENYCSFCKKKFKKENNSDIDYLLSEIIKDQKIIKEKINFYILLSDEIRNLYLNKKLKLIIKYSPNYDDITPKEAMNLINNISNEDIFENIKDFDMNFTLLNILDYISTIENLIDRYIKKKGDIFIDVDKALSNKKGTSLYISGILARFLMNEGINVAIEKKNNFT